ncbi:MAG: hypothetical protein OSJ58_19035, partial [Dysosmobacter sp.]|nr:hypothetical protein [Dysosmobacter sp.]
MRHDPPFYRREICLKKKYIRFINSDYKTLFHLPDGGRVRIIYPDGRRADRVCRFIDEYHTDMVTIEDLVPEEHLLRKV